MNAANESKITITRQPPKPWVVTTGWNGIGDPAWRLEPKK